MEDSERLPPERTKPQALKASELSTEKEVKKSMNKALPQPQEPKMPPQERRPCPNNIKPIGIKIQVRDPCKRSCSS